MTDIESAIVAHVLYVNAAPNGKVFTVALELNDGRKLALDLSLEEGSKIVDGLSRTRLAVAGNTVGGIASKVDTVDLDADALGRAVIRPFEPATSSWVGSQFLPIS